MQAVQTTGSQQIDHPQGQERTVSPQTKIRDVQIMEVVFPVLVDGHRWAMTQDHFTEAWKSKSIQEHLLIVALATIEEVAQTLEDYRDIGEFEQPPRVMPGES